MGFHGPSQIFLLFYTPHRYIYLVAYHHHHMKFFGNHEITNLALDPMKSHAVTIVSWAST